MKNVVQDLTSAGIDWQREKWQSGLGSKFIHQGEKNAVKYADEVIVLSKGVQDYFKETYGRETHFIPNGVNALKSDLKTKKAELKSIDKEIARIEVKKIKAETKAAESAKKAEAEDVLKKLLASGVSADEILAKLK